MAVVALIVVVLIIFVVGGLFGWLLKALGWVFEFLQEGCSTSCGCLAIAILIILVLAALAA